MSAPDDDRPTRSEAEADARQDEIDRRATERRVQAIAARLGFADRIDLINAVCPEPWNWLHPGHHECERLTENLRITVARIIDRYR